jgi:hypothetical protein
MNENVHPRECRYGLLPMKKDLPAIVRRGLSELIAHSDRVAIDLSNQLYLNLENDPREGTGLNIVKRRCALMHPRKGLARRHGTNRRRAMSGRRAMSRRREAIHRREVIRHPEPIHLRSGLSHRRVLDPPSRNPIGRLVKVRIRDNTLLVIVIVEEANLFYEIRTLFYSMPSVEAFGSSSYAFVCCDSQCADNRSRTQTRSSTRTCGATRRSCRKG